MSLGIKIISWVDNKPGINSELFNRSNESGFDYKLLTYVTSYEKLRKTYVLEFVRRNIRRCA